MVKGVLGIIICPMLEDELLHFMCKDKDVGRIVLLDNPHSGSIREKLEKNGTKFELVPQADFEAGKLQFDRGIFNIVILANDLALHAEPADLRAYVEKQITDIQPLVDALGLYYGMCGNYGWDVTTWCKEKGYKPAAVFRGTNGKVCDDCVAVCLGGSEQYLKLQKAHTGQLYVIPAIAHNWVPFMMAGNAAKSVADLPAETRKELGIENPEDFLRWLFEFCGYHNTLKIDTGLADSEQFDREFREITSSMNLKPLVIEDGWVTLRSAEDLYEECRSLLA